MCNRLTIFIALAGVALIARDINAGSAVVTQGKFTNVYVYPNSDTETWEQHMDRLRPTDAPKFSRASIDNFTGGTNLTL